MPRPFSYHRRYLDLGQVNRPIKVRQISCTSRKPHAHTWPMLAHPCATTLIIANGQILVAVKSPMFSIYAQSPVIFNFTLGPIIWKVSGSSGKLQANIFVTSTRILPSTSPEWHSTPAVIIPLKDFKNPLQILKINMFFF